MGKAVGAPGNGSGDLDDLIYSGSEGPIVSQR